jgi:hypothetical protein
VTILFCEKGHQKRREGYCDTCRKLARRALLKAAGSSPPPKKQPAIIQRARPPQGKPLALNTCHRCGSDSPGLGAEPRCRMCGAALPPGRFRLMPHDPWVAYGELG